MNSHCKDKTVSSPSYLYHVNPISGKTAIVVKQGPEIRFDKSHESGKNYQYQNNKTKQNKTQSYAYFMEQNGVTNDVGMFHWSLMYGVSLMAM